MNRFPISHISWLLPGAVQLEHRNGDVAGTLDRSCISPELLRQKDAWITKRQLYRFYHEAARRSGGADFGFAAGTLVTPSQLGPLGAAMAAAATFGEALHIFCRLTPLHVENVRLWLEPDEADPGQTWFCTRTGDWVPGLSETAEHVALASMVNLIRIAGGSTWRC